jgi:penicillin-binding protein 1A
MRVALNKFGNYDFVAPSGIVNVAIDSTTGELYQDGPNRFIEAFVEGTEPGSDNNIVEGEEPDSGTSIYDTEDYYSAQ